MRGFPADDRRQRFFPLDLRIVLRDRVERTQAFVRAALPDADLFHGAAGCSGSGGRRVRGGRAPASRGRGRPPRRGGSGAAESLLRPGRTHRLPHIGKQPARVGHDAVLHRVADGADALGAPGLAVRADRPAAAALSDTSGWTARYSGGVLRYCSHFFATAAANSQRSGSTTGQSSSRSTAIAFPPCQLIHRTRSPSFRTPTSSFL